MHYKRGADRDNSTEEGNAWDDRSRDGRDVSTNHGITTTNHQQPEEMINTLFLKVPEGGWPF